ncbi:glutathione S-transferase, partial [Xanthomonas perforans]
AARPASTASARATAGRAAADGASASG